MASPPLSNSSGIPPMPPQIEGSNKNGLPSVVEEKPCDFAPFQILDSMEYMDKYRKYEDDYSRRLMAKYFSEKNLYGGNVYDEKISIGDEIIMSSRWPFTQSFADPLKGLEEQRTSVSPSASGS